MDLTKTKLVKYMRRTKNIEPFGSQREGATRLVARVGCEEQIKEKFGYKVVHKSPPFSHPSLAHEVQVYFCKSLN